MTTTKATDEVGDEHMKKIDVRVSDELFEQLNEAFSRSDCHTKNDFYSQILSVYCLTKNPSFVNFLPEILRGLCESILSENSKIANELCNEVTKCSELACQKVVNLCSDLSDYIPQRDILAED